MTKNDLISVIVPVYNTESYLTMCVDSILAQTYKHIEIILVDDGSPDSAGKMCDDFAKKYPQVKAVHKQNEGLNMARKTGFENATGDWVIFVDSDDALHPQALETVFNAAVASKTELVIGGYRRFSGDEEFEKSGVIDASNAVYVKNKDEAIHWLIRDAPYDNVFMQTAWMKLYARHIVAGINWEFCNYRANEDEFMAIQYYPKLKKGLVIVPEDLYYYRINDNSITRARYRNEFNGAKLSKFEMIEALRRDSLDKLGNKFEKDILIRFTVQFLGFIEQYMDEGALDDSVFSDYEAYFKPQINNMDRIKDDLSEWNYTRFLAVKTKGLVGMFGVKVEVLKNRVENLEVDLEEKERMLGHLREELIALHSPGILLASRKLAGSIKRRIKKY